MCVPTITKIKFWQEKSENIPYAFYVQRNIHKNIIYTHNSQKEENTNVDVGKINIRDLQSVWKNQINYVRIQNQ